MFFFSPFNLGQHLKTQELWLQIHISGISGEAEGRQYGVRLMLDDHNCWCCLWLLSLQGAELSYLPQSSPLPTVLPRLVKSLNPVPVCVCIWGWVVPPITPSRAPTPAGCPTIQLNSDCLPGVSIGSHKTALSSPTEMPTASPGCHLCFWVTSSTSKVPTTASWAWLIC